MEACQTGEGRTEIFLSMISSVDKFKKLNNSRDKDPLVFNRNTTLYTASGIFSVLGDEFRTTSVVANIINNMRSLEERVLGESCYIETAWQCQTLDLLHLMLIINERMQNDPSFSDDKILSCIYDNDFPKELISQFGSVYFRLHDDVLIEADLLKSSEKNYCIV
ncbi:MAG: hypothetical protein QS748_02130 [Candidatus Endonucleobacter bathymodioli]|uniref:Uncharacterized protein n=1 Tax=Candidatus Endonucleibacter bathymodioli TaxID=539814 RepID=A0AA90NWG4_9GAMM|nr:hypothetical protein [Candidatus Endonucleobacter bathymodioli]